jgi:hypothetical protein
LPALFGLAQQFKDLRGRYAAGIWEKDMPSALLWRTEIPPVIPQLGVFNPRRPLEYRAQSWSWASVDGSITYESQMRCLTRDQYDFSKSEYDFGHFKLSNFAVHAAGEDPTGAVAGGYLYLKGSLKYAIFTGTALRGEYGCAQRWRKLSTSEGLTIGAASIDVLTELYNGQAVSCLSLRREMDYLSVGVPHDLYKGDLKAEDEERWEAMIMGLGLVRSEEYTGFYKRVGLVRWMKESCFSGVEPSGITII